jgi:hypothetical protein
LAATPHTRSYSPAECSSTIRSNPGSARSISRRTDGRTSAPVPTYCSVARSGMTTATRSANVTRPSPYATSVSTNVRFTNAAAHGSTPSPATARGSGRLPRHSASWNPRGVAAKSSSAPSNRSTGLNRRFRPRNGSTARPSASRR